jgi:hypothetical protein
MFPRSTAPSLWTDTANAPHASWFAYRAADSKLSTYLGSGIGFAISVLGVSWKSVWIPITRLRSIPIDSILQATGYQSDGPESHPSSVHFVPPQLQASMYMFSLVMEPQALDPVTLSVD